MMCAESVRVRVCASLHFCRRRETYTRIVELIGFDHDCVVSFRISVRYAKMEMLSVDKSCVLKRASGGLRINNAATNKTWKQRHKRGFSETVLFFLCIIRKKTD